MKLGLVSYEFKNKDISFNVSQIKRAIAESDADMLCFGEAFLQGFDSLNWEHEKDKNIAISQDSAIMQDIISFAKQFKKDLAFGYIERDNEFLYSSYAVILGGKLFYNYRRISKGWKEFTLTNSFYREGNGTEEFYYKNHWFKVALCGDLWEEALKEIFKAKDILLWPVYVNYSLKEWQNELKEYVCQASYYSNRVLLMNSLSENPRSYGGAFYIENGELKGKTNFGKEEILIVEV